jgi:hypothetical protein
MPAVTSQRANVVTPDRCVGQRTARERFGQTARRRCPTLYRPGHAPAQIASDPAYAVTLVS